MPRIVIAFIALAILASVGVAGLQSSLETAGEDYDIENETWTPDPGSVTELDNSNRAGAYYAENVTVYNESDVEMDAGDDYRWHSSNGTVEALAGGDLDGDSSATITYRFQQTTEDQRQFASLLGQVPRMMGFALPLGAVMFLFVLLRGA